jgi:probable rRNA maturation factor
MKRGQSQEMMSERLLTDISVSHSEWATAIVDVESVCHRAALAAFEASVEIELAHVEVSILLSDDKYLRSLNKKYRGIDKSTNVLSFANLDENNTAQFKGAPQLLGDVVIAFETTLSEAKQEDKKLTDHLSHLVVHGIFHLLGHNHEHYAQAALMEALETSTLIGLGIPDPYNGTELMDLG